MRSDGFEFVEHLIRPARRRQQIAKMIVHCGIVGGQGDRFLIFGDGVRRFAQFAEPGRRGIVSKREIGLDGQSLLDIANSVFDAPLFVKRRAEIRQRLGIIGRETERI